MDTGSHDILYACLGFATVQFWDLSENYIGVLSFRNYSILLPLNLCAAAETTVEFCYGSCLGLLFCRVKRFLNFFRCTI